MDLPFISSMKNTTLSKRSYISKRNIFTSKASMRKEVNFYQILSLDSKNAGADEIKKAYRSMALHRHPDVHPPSKREESTRMFVELQKAYETLSNPVMREKYDFRLASVNFTDGEGDNGERRWRDRSMYPKEDWIDQLDLLRIRSDKRMARMT